MILFQMRDYTRGAFLGKLDLLESGVVGITI